MEASSRRSKIEFVQHCVNHILESVVAFLIQKRDNAPECYPIFTPWNSGTREWFHMRARLLGDACG